MALERNLRHEYAHSYRGTCEEMPELKSKRMGEKNISNSEGNWGQNVEHGESKRVREFSTIEFSNKITQ